MKHCIITLFCVFFLISCGRDYDNTWYVIGEFPPPIELQGKSILKNEFGVIMITSAHSYIITSTIRDTLFHVYDENLNFLGGFGQEGQGPHEFPHIGLIRDAIKHDDSTIVFAIDPARYKNYSIDLISTLESDELVVSHEYELAWDLHGAYLSFYVDKNTVIGTYRDHFHQRLDGKYGLFYYYPGTDSIEIYPLYNLDIYANDGQPVNDPSAIMNINSHASALSPDRSKFAVQLMYTPRLEVFTIGDPQPSRFLLQPEAPSENFELNSFHQGKITKYYNDIQASDDYIYLLYSGHTEADDEIRELEKTIQVIDWEGNTDTHILSRQNFPCIIFRSWVYSFYIITSFLNNHRAFPASGIPHQL